MPDNHDDEQAGRRAQDRELGYLRQDLDAKHNQNRRDIHDVRNKFQSLLLEFVQMQSKVKPLLDNGQPGLISKMSAKLDQLLDEINEVRVSQAQAKSTDEGRRDEGNWWRDAIKALIVGGAVALASHFWK